MYEMVAIFNNRNKICPQQLLLTHSRFFLQRRGIIYNWGASCWIYKVYKLLWKVQVVQECSEDVSIDVRCLLHSSIYHEMN